MKYESKVSNLEERDDIDLMTVDGLHGIFTAYEMRIGKNEPSRKQETFKVSKQPNKYQTPSKNHSKSSNDE